MNKEDILKRALNSGPRKFLEKNSNLGIIKLRSTTQIVQKRGSDKSETQSNDTLQLRIMTDSASPTYQDWFGDTFQEKIGKNAFDESLDKVAKGELTIFSFADHYMDSENIISSTKRDGTKLYKDEDDNYVMEMELDDSIELHQRIKRLVENEELIENSFIFQPTEAEFMEKADSELDYELTYTKGDLISIDPVVFAFYPQNEIKLKESIMAKELEKNLEERASKKTVAKEEAKVEETKVEETIEEVVEAEVKEAEVKEEVVEVKEEAKAEPKDEDKKTDEEVLEEVAKEANTDGPKASSMAEKRSKELVAAELKNAELAKLIKKQNGENMKKTNERALNDFLKKGMQNNEASKTDVEAVRSALAERNEKVLDRVEISNDELAMNGLTRDALTGADAASGALIIPVSTDPNVTGQDVITTPEFNGARRIGIIGLAEKKLPVDVDTFADATEKAQGEDAVQDDQTVVKLQVSPKRYPMYFTYNPLLAEHASFVEQKTTNQRNKITNSWLTGFYGSLLTHIAVTFDSVKETYTGGATSEAVLESAASGVVDDEDLQEMIQKFEERYGFVNEGELVAFMKSATWTAIRKAAKLANNAALIRVVNGKTMFGAVEVVIRNKYPEGIVVGEHPILLTKKANIVVYGGSVVIKNSTEAKFLSEQNTRLVSGTGMARLSDPFYSTFVLKVKA